MQTPDTHLPPDDRPTPPQETTAYFPAISQTSEQENRAIEQAIAASEARRNAPQIAYYDEEEETAPEEQADSAAPESAAVTAPEKRIRFKEIPPFVGLFSLIRQKYADQAGKKNALSFLVGTLTIFVLLITLASMAVIYAICTAVVLFGALLLLLFCVALVAAGLAGLCYGIVLLFTHGVVIALVEIGLALMLFGIILALSALAGELATHQLMKLVKFLTRLFLYCIFYLLSFVFGRDRVLRDKNSERTVLPA